MEANLLGQTPTAFVARKQLPATTHCQSHTHSCQPVYIARDASSMSPP